MAREPGWGLDCRWPGWSACVTLASPVVALVLARTAEARALARLGPGWLALGLVPLVAAALLSRRVRRSINLLEAGLVAGFAGWSFPFWSRAIHTMVYVDPKWEVPLACLNAGAYAAVAVGLWRDALRAREVTAPAASGR